jgi:hypothetical protein
MATFNKFEQFVEDLGVKVHDLNADTLRVYISNAAPSSSADAVKADLATITEENGYSAADVQNAFSQTSGTATLTATDVVWTASGGSFGPGRYVALYNDTPSSPADPLIGWWDYGSSVTVLTGETFTVDFGASVLTLA